METTSYDVIAKMATGLHVGMRAHRTLSVHARLRILAGISSLETPDRWPELPIDVSAFPDTQEGWKGYPDFYPTCTANDDFARIFGRFGDMGIGFFTKLADRPYPSEKSSRANTPEPKAQSPPAEAKVTEDKEAVDSSQIKSQPLDGRTFGTHVERESEANTGQPVNVVNTG
jgi:hypothetical protein